MKAAKAKVNLEPLMSALDPFDKLSELLKPFLALFPDIRYLVPSLHSLSASTPLLLQIVA